MLRAIEQRQTADFRDVQRLQRRPVEHSPREDAAARPPRPLEHGCIGDYQLDYMGAAEFENGAVRRAYDRLTTARDGLAQGVYTFNGVEFDFAWISSESDPYPIWFRWMCEKQAFVEENLGNLLWENDLREPTELFMQLGLIERVDSIENRGQVWWALDGNVMWGLHDGEDGHLLQMLRSMGETPVDLAR